MAAKMSTADILAIQDYSAFTTAELISMRIKASEAVNRQMRRWDAAGLKNKPSAYTRYATPYLRKYGRDRFSTKKTAIAGKTDSQQRRAEIAELSAMARLYNAPTYSIKGYRDTKRKAVEGLARAAGIDLNSPEGRKFVEETAESLVGSDQWGWLKRTVGSDVLLKVSRKIAQGNATQKEVLQRIEEMRQRDIAGRTYVDATTGELVTEKPETWEEESTITRNGVQQTVINKRERSMFTDWTEEAILREIGFSSNPNNIYEEFGDD